MAPNAIVRAISQGRSPVITYINNKIGEAFGHASSSLLPTHIGGAGSEANKGHSQKPYNPKRQHGTVHVVVTIFLWMGLHCLATFLNNDLLGHKAHLIPPLTLTLVHLMVSCGTDYLLLTQFSRKVGLDIQYEPIGSLWSLKYLIPIGIFMVSAKALTYISYEYVPVSLAHTAKATAPIFAVVLSYVMYSRVYATYTYLSLIPVVMGVILASINEIQYNHIGFLAATASTVIGVLQNFYTKKIMNVSCEYNLHYRVAFVSCVILAPVVLIQEVYAPSLNSAPWGSLLLASMIQYAASLSAYIAMSMVSNLSYSVLNTLKRVVIIGNSVWWYNHSLTLGNAFGIALSTFGLLLYNFAKHHEARKPVSCKRGSVTGAGAEDMEFQLTPPVLNDFLSAS